MGEQPGQGEELEMLVVNLIAVISAVISGEMWIVRYKALRAQLQKIHHEKNFGNW